MTKTETVICLGTAVPMVFVSMFTKKTIRADFPPLK